MRINLTSVLVDEQDRALYAGGISAVVGEIVQEIVGEPDDESERAKFPDDHPDGAHAVAPLAESAR